MDPVLFPLYCYHLFTLLALFTLLVYYYCFPLDTLIPLFIANRWDWQTHRKLETKYLVVLCAGSALLLAEDALTSYRKRRPCWSVTRLASITFWSLAFSWIRHTLVSFWGKSLLLYSSYLPLGVPNWTVIYINTPCRIISLWSNHCNESSCQWHHTSGMQRLIHTSQIEEISKNFWAYDRLQVPDHSLGGYSNREHWSCTRWNIKIEKKRD
jgi:hypothetical protein